MKKTNHFQKQLKLHCSRCQTIYQLIEVHSQESPNCSNDCWIKWQSILHEYYQEKVLGYITQKEQAEEIEENLAKKLTRIVRENHQQK